MPTSTKQTAKKVQFIDHHKPSLKSGHYQIAIQQLVEIKQDNGKPIKDTFQKEQKFQIQGDRFTIPPQTIYDIYPAAGSTGNFSTTLPHIILNRSTLPWERQATSSLWLNNANQTSDYPWLVLLLFHDGEVNKPQGIKLKELLNNNAKETDTDTEISLIDIPKQLFQQILPKPEELKLLTHVRKGTKEDGTKAELAVIISNRLPKPKCINTVYLVSLEKDFSNTPEYVRLVSFKTWDFTCEDNDDKLGNHFETLVQNLNKPVEVKNTENTTKPPSTPNVEIPKTLRLPDKPESNNPVINQYLKMGYIPLLHHLRNGEKMVSWYHSPLLPGKTNNNNLVEFPNKSTDDLLLYNPEHGLFDISYSSAWQLGRLLALQDKNFSMNLYNWKRQKNIANQLANLTPVQLLFTTTPEINIPKSVISWFKDVLLLKNIPFNYLVPSPEMLPMESLRFFWIDNYWLDCLIDGAFGMGNGYDFPDNYRKYKQLIMQNINKDEKSIVTGFLLRSEAVSGYQGIEIKGFNNNSPDSSLEILRRDRLSNDVLICLFSGEVKQIQISQKAETLHFGFSSNSGKLNKKMRNPKDGKIIDNNAYNLSNEDWRDRDKKIINIENLDKSLKTNNNAANFSLQMVESAAFIEFKNT